MGEMTMVTGQKRSLRERSEGGGNDREQNVGPVGLGMGQAAEGGGFGEIGVGFRVA